MSSSGPLREREMIELNKAALYLMLHHTRFLVHSACEVTEAAVKRRYCQEMTVVKE